MRTELLAFARVWQTAADPALQAHGELTRVWAAKIAACVRGLSEADKASLAIAAEFHDIGKVFVPQVIVHKTGKLGVAEDAAMRMHPELGARLFAFPEMLFISELILSHHEWYDGKGYPNHLRGDEIALAGRVLSVADSIAAMLETRAYRASASLAEVASEMRKWYGSQFDPYVAGIAVQLLENEAGGAMLFPVAQVA